MLKRLFSRHQKPTQQPVKPMFENVESRLLMHSPAFTNAIADNKGNASSPSRIPRGWRLPPARSAVPRFKCTRPVPTGTSAGLTM